MYLDFSDGKLTVLDTLLVDNKKSKDKSHGEILSEAYASFLKFCAFYPKPDLFIREMALGTMCHSVTMALNKMVGAMDLALHHMYGEIWEEGLRPVSIKKTLTDSGRADKSQ